MPPIVTVLDLDHATEADLADIHALAVACHPVDKPEDPEPTRETAVGRLRTEAGMNAVDALWAARVSGRLVGYARLMLLDDVNAGMAHVRVEVHPAHRRTGVGAALLRPAAEHAARHDRGVLVALPVKPGSPGLAWITRLGFVITRHAVILRLSVREDGAAQRWNAPVAPGYRLVQWSKAAPEELIASYALARKAIADAPRGASAYRDDKDWTPESIRRQEATNAADGTEAWVTVAVSEADGTVAGLTHVTRYPHTPELGFQLDTSVLAEHRGRGLGLAVKGAMVRRLVEAWPELQRIHTNNAADNVHMLAVNRALGYRPLREMIHSEVETAALIDTLARLD